MALIKYTDVITNTRGDSLPDYRVQVVTSAGAAVDIYSDGSGTRFRDASGNVVNYSTATSTGKVEFYWTPAEGQILQTLDTGGTLVDTDADFADKYVLGNLAGEVPQDQVANLPTDLASINSAVATKAAIADLASTDAAKGASLIKRTQGGTVQAAMQWVVPEDHGAVGDGTTDDSTAMQAAIDALEARGGGKLLLASSYLVGGLTIDAPNIVVEGLGRDAKIIVKDGTTGFTVSEDFVHFRSLTLESEGSMTDGLGTNGILYTKGATNLSIGHIYNYDLTIGRESPGNAAGPGGFSGVGIEYRNALDLTMIACFHYKCATGLKFGRNGTNSADFSTTVQMLNCYFIACADYGIDGSYLYRSSLNIIGEYNGVAIRINIGDFDLYRCYFENNTTAGGVLTDVSGQDINNYSHPSLGVNTVTRTRSAIGNTSWFTSGQTSGDFYTKRQGIQSTWGRDTKYLAGIGTTSTTGLSFGTGVVPVKRGPNLLVPSAWEGEGNGSGGGAEFVGWVGSKGAYEISGALTSARGMRQTVTVTAGQTYVMEWVAENVSGASLTTARVGTDTVTSGVPFTASASGSVVVKLFGVQSGAHENLVKAISLAQVDAIDTAQVAELQDRLSTPRPTRNLPPVSSAPTYKMASGEFVPNGNPTVDGNNMVIFGWLRTGAGTTVPLYVSTVSPAT